MADAPASAEQKEEMVRAGLGGAAAEGAVAGILHRGEEQRQLEDVMEQQVAAQKADAALEPKNLRLRDDPIRKLGLDSAAVNRHTQHGSHGMSGQAPK